ncbi:MAG: ABC transporter ATP-binding protein [Phycisphaerales bacterium]|jgi:ABC-2 type transport system ATP-binding protein|nr:ABC transporter ATP-binding protein [Phycisphaerales bacterium]
MTRCFGTVKAVDDVSFEIERGRVAGFLGPNGAGKTTSMRMLAGVLPPTSGRAFIGGHDVMEQPRAAHASLGWLPEGAPACDELRVEEYVRYRGALAGGVPRRRYAELLARCDLMDVRRRLVGQLSRGYRQRVALAAALVGDPAALILDEPSTGLDPVQQRAFRRLVRELAEDRAILFSTHQVGDALAVCDDLLVIVGGSLKAAGDLASLRGAAGRRRVVLEAAGVDLAATLGAMSQVHDLEVQATEGDWHRAVCTLKDDVRDDLVAAIMQAGGRLRLLRDAEGSLEQWLHGLLEGGSA